MLGNLHVRFGVGGGGQFPALHHHIGAAMVLLSETKNGYPHYLLAVGHLHEAEDEAQAWPDLAAAIRAVRKELQTTGAVPEWSEIMGRIERIWYFPASSLR